MKKFFLLFFVLILGLNACKLKRIENPKPEYIVGEWRLERAEVEGIPYDVGDCIKRSVMYFSSNHDAHSIIYTVNPNTDQCEIHLEHEGKWVFEDDKWFIIVEKENGHDLIPNQRKEMIFTDPSHAYTNEVIEGYRVRLFFYKVEE